MTLHDESGSPMAEIDGLALDAKVQVIVVGRQVFAWDYCWSEWRRDVDETVCVMQGETWIYDYACGRWRLTRPVVLVVEEVE